ncbi:MAG: ADP-ribosylglycohydrolase family protein [Marivita sp.]|uniref:ADP-ribosylglycohydrolase family protein n=1 Tax=Marivita sp. TaxID=2003365 RepID=UPI003EF841F0
MTHSPISAMLLGALVSDAASLGLHWLYDADRIAEIADTRGSAAFTPVDSAHFDGVQGYFAHGARASGMFTQYGEVLWLAIQSMNVQGGEFDVAAYQAAFAAHFGPGGGFCGYIDRPTRGTLENIAAGVTPSGIDDDQNPAVARLPAIVAAYHGTDALTDQVRAAMQVTNVNEVADAYSAVFTDLLVRVLNGAPVADALKATNARADSAVKAALMDALTTREADSTVYAGVVGRACHLPTSGPVMVHVLRHSTSYADAVERNIRAGGDSAGRAILIGAVMGAAHGIATPTGVPLSWVLQLHNGAAIWDGCARLGSV